MRSPIPAIVSALILQLHATHGNFASPAAPAAGAGVRLQFNPPHQLVRIEESVRHITNRLAGAPLSTAEIDLAGMTRRHSYRRTPDGIQWTEVVTNDSRKVNSKDLGWPAVGLTRGHPTTKFFAPDGRFLREEGRESLLNASKAALPRQFHAALESTLTSDRMTLRVWKLGTGRLVGRTVREGDVWHETIVVPDTKPTGDMPTYTVTAILRVQAEGGRTLITALTAQTTVESEIQAVGAGAPTDAAIEQFFDQRPRPNTSARVVSRQTFDAATLLPVRELTRMRKWNLAGRGVMISDEHEERIWRDLPPSTTP
jgi:hypothetical protein